MAKIFSIVAIVMMMFSLVSPVSATPNSTGVASKFSDSLQTQFELEDEVTFIVTFKQKADSIKVAQDSLQKAEAANLSSEDAELMQRNSVISALEATANKAQKNVASYLNNEQLDYQSYYITNAMVLTATEDVAKKIAAYPEVSMLLPNFQIELVEPEAMVKQTEVNADSSVLWNVDMVNAPALWQEGVDGEGIVIASLDTGAQWDHPAIKSSYRGYNDNNGSVSHEGNFFDPYTGRQEAYDDNGHGTHTIGTMTGYVPAESPYEQIADTYIGVAPGAKWISAKILNGNGSGTTDKILEAAEWVMAPNGDASLAPDVVNNSWGFPGVNPLEVDEFFRDVVQNWRAAGLFPVFAAGNEVPGVVYPVPGSISMPSSYPEAFAVGAVDSEKNLAPFSLRGPSPYDEVKPEVVAAGVDIISAVPGNGYASASGTSMAAPAVAGVVALLLQDNDGVDFDTVEDALTNTAEALMNEEYTEAPNDGFGHGLVDAYLANEVLKEDSNPDPEPEPEPETIDRLYGENRYETAIEISQDGWEDGSLADGIVILARGDNFADALAGVPLAHALGSPILLTPSNRLLDEVLTEIDRLGAQEVIILGGDLAVSDDVQAKLDRENFNTKRLEGDTRYDTAAEIAKAITGGETSHVILANGTNFPDALSVASSAAQTGIPILLTKANTIPDATQAAMDSLGVQNVYAIGGERVVSEELFAQLPNPARLGGANRFETNIEILMEFGVPSNHMYVATGMDYADALTGATLAAKNETAVLLVKDKVPDSIVNYVLEYAVADLTIFGGPAAVSEKVEERLVELLNN